MKCGFEYTDYEAEVDFRYWTQVALIFLSLTLLQSSVLSYYVSPITMDLIPLLAELIFGNQYALRFNDR